MCQSLKNILLNSVGGHRCMPHCIVGRPINSWQEQQQLCCPHSFTCNVPSSALYQAQYPAVMPTAVWGALAIKHLSVCLSDSEFPLWFAVIDWFSSGTPSASFTPIAIHVSESRLWDHLYLQELQQLFVNSCFPGLFEFVILESTDFESNQGSGPWLHGGLLWISKYWQLHEDTRKKPKGIFIGVKTCI